MAAAPTLPGGQPPEPPPEWDGLGPDPAGTLPADPLEAWDHPPSGQVPALPTIRVQAGPGEIGRMIRETIHALGEHDRNLYQRSGEMVRIVREPERREAYEVDVRHGSDIIMRPGTPKLVPAGPVLLERIDAAARWERFDARRGEREKDEGGKAKRGGKASGEWVTCAPDATVVRAVATRRDWPGIRPTKGIIENPCLGPGGRLITAPGYDEETGYVLLPSVDVGEIRERPTQDHARAALRYLWTEIACDFPFREVGEPSAADPERALQWGKAIGVPDAFVGIAALLTVFARPAILGAVPAALFEAAGQGSGKSLQIHTIAMVATGRPASVATFPVRDGRPNEEELEKIIMGYALTGARIVAFDNVRGLLAGGTLERALTAVDTIDGRVLGSNDQRSLPWSPVMMFSGNNMVANDDVAQRMIYSRIESPREDPRSRPSSSFRHPNLLEAIKARRARLVRAVLVILRAYIAARDAGEDVPRLSRGNFEAWGAIVPSAIAWAGGPNVIKAFPEAGRGGDEEGEAHGVLLRMWRDEWQGQKGSAILEMMFAHEEEVARNKKQGMPTPPDNLDDLRAAVRALTKTREGGTPSAHAFGIKLRGLRGKIRDGRRLDVDLDKSAKVAVFRVTQVTA